MNIDNLNPGDRVIYRPNFGDGGQMIGTVTGTDTHKGQPVVDFTNNSWAYAHQVDRIYDDH